MAKTKKMTLKYWNSLSEGSKKRALTYCFPLHKATVDSPTRKMMLGGGLFGERCESPKQMPKGTGTIRP